MNQTNKIRRASLTGLSKLLEYIQPVAIDSSENSKFIADLQVDLSIIWDRYFQLSEDLGLETNENLVSFHHIALIALAMSGKPIRRILELGTFQGYTTALLAQLFPDSEIHTVDLPDDDPILSQPTEARWIPGEAVQLEKLQGTEVNRRLSTSNISRWRKNTLFLPALPLPKSFDLVWIDASHHYPEVAWDHFFGLNVLARGGWLLSDDVRLPDNPLFKEQPHSTDVWDVLKYLKARLNYDFYLLLKRSDPILYRTDPKFVAAFHRPL
jgi:predicted O-methyltransferase YrrM